jgi:molybdenum cofactor cytidylyltransferase
MDMAYTKALKLMKHAESSLGFSLTTRVSGGKDGGGSILTPEGKAWLSRYEAYIKACEEANQQLLRKFYPKVGCVIMASGLGKRFGSNKLMADFNGKPMILQALDASRSLMESRVVVTRHEDVAKLCREQGVHVVLHDFPHRSDTVRLGLEALGEVDACMFLPGDQPLLRPETVNLLVSRWESDQQKIVRPFCENTPGSPVVFPKWAFEQLCNLPEGKGGGLVMKQHPESVAVIPISDPYELMDADTPETLELLQHRNKRK